jgi:HipA-like C-terminal domain
MWMNKGNRFGAWRTSAPCWDCGRQRSITRHGRRIAKAVRDHVPGEHQHENFLHLSAILMLTYALRNADCHAKNLAWLYTSRRDVRLSPAYDFLTTSVYASYQNNPPGISLLGKKTWTPGMNGKVHHRHIWHLRQRAVVTSGIGQRCGCRGCSSGSGKNERAHRIRGAGKRILLAWQEGITGLRDRRVYAAGERPAGEVFEGISDPPNLQNTKVTIGRSPRLGDRSEKSEHRLAASAIFTRLAPIQGQRKHRADYPPRGVNERALMVYAWIPSSLPMIV